MKKKSTRRLREKREKILELVNSGKTLEEIAQAMNIWPASIVQYHIDKAKQKSGWGGMSKDPRAKAFDTNRGFYD